MPDGDTNGKIPAPLERPAPARVLPAAAMRALAESQARQAAATQADRPVELSGRKGPEPVRYGDWEVKGIATDF